MTAVMVVVRTAVASNPECHLVEFGNIEYAGDKHTATGVILGNLVEMDPINGGSNRGWPIGSSGSWIHLSSPVALNMKIVVSAGIGGRK